MANVVEVSERIPLEQLRLTAEWSRLTPKQAAFVSKYVQSGGDGEYNAIEAARETYNCSSERNLTNMAAEALSNPKVRAVVALHFGHSDLDLLIQDLQKAADSTSGVAKVEALKTLARLKFNVSEEPPELAKRSEPSAKPEPEPAGSRREIFKVGDIVRVDGLARRVLAVDSTGTVTDVSDEVIA